MAELSCMQHSVLVYGCIQLHGRACRSFFLALACARPLSRRPLSAAPARPPLFICKQNMNRERCIRAIHSGHECVHRMSGNWCKTEFRNSFMCPRIDLYVHICICGALCFCRGNNSHMHKFTFKRWHIRRPHAHAALHHVCRPTRLHTN